MAKSSKSKAPSTLKTAGTAQVARIVTAVLLVLNLVAAYLVLYPPGGSQEALEQKLGQLQGQVRQARARTEETKRAAQAVQKGRTAADEFLAKYFVTRRTLPTNLLEELRQIARSSGIQDRGNAFSIDLIEGSDMLGMVTITANFEGTYRNLLNFVREIDRSPSLLIVESLNAAPQQGSNNLMVAMKMEAFIREDGSLPEQVAQTEGPR
jgi:Tfp pilus assembly protein PilO